MYALNTQIFLTMNFTPPSVPASAERYMPENIESFGDGLWYVIKNAIFDLRPDIASAAGICFSVIAVILIVTLIDSFSDTTKRVSALVASVALSVILFQPSNAMIRLGIETVEEISQYGKLFLPVMTAALAAQGGVTASTALYAGTAFFNALLSTVLVKLIVPMIYVYLALCIANSVMGESTLSNMRKFVKWLMTWTLKISLYVFTGFIGITGVVSGTADAAAIKAAKIALNGAVPVIGNVISEASETILISAGVMKNSAGVFGLIAIIAMWIGPFLKIAVQYLLIKLTAALCDIFGGKEQVKLIKDFTGILGILLAATGTMCLLLFISTVCFMRGTG